MTARDITLKTGIEQRTYTAWSWRSYRCSGAAGHGEEWTRAGRIRLGAFCSCTARRRCRQSPPGSPATRHAQTHASVTSSRPCGSALYRRRGDSSARGNRAAGALVAGEKFSDKIGTVRASRMLSATPPRPFDRPGAGGGAARRRGLPDLCERPDERGRVDHLPIPIRQQLDGLRPGGSGAGQTLHGADDRSADGLPHPMAGWLAARCHRAGRSHQANKTMVTAIAEAAASLPKRLYFNIDRVGNTSSASIPSHCRMLSTTAFHPSDADLHPRLRRGPSGLHRRCASVRESSHKAPEASYSGCEEAPNMRNPPTGDSTAPDIAPSSP